MLASVLKDIERRMLQTTGAGQGAREEAIPEDLADSTEAFVQRFRESDAEALHAFAQVFVLLGNHDEVDVVAHDRVTMKIEPEALLCNAEAVFDYRQKSFGSK